MSTDNKRNILASLMQQPQQHKQPTQNRETELTDPTRKSIKTMMTNSNAARPTSVFSNSSMQSASSKQHKLSKRFTVIRKLGRGTYGKVQLAINKQTGQEVAIKTIKKSKIDNEEDMQRVRREIQIMRSIEHPHIIHIYEEFENKDKIVLIMQYAPGGELYEYVSQSKCLDNLEARRLFRQIATAIYYCHQNKICHRDLKLENILLDEKNNAKLADFGLSNVFDKQSQLKTFCGSPLYASPEIVQGSPYKGPEVDCWSLGVLLYTLVYGAMPFDGSNFKRLVKQISDASYFEPSERSPASPLIRHLLCADPKKRATIIDICSDPWVNGLIGSPLSPRTELTTMPTNSKAENQPPIVGNSTQHPSLLKVAQDMADLTPVRIDMLLALTMGEQAARQQREEAAQASVMARPPLAPIVDYGNTSSSRSRTEQPKRVSPMEQMTLDPSTVMEVDESRATSPIASYIVRDLDPPVSGGEHPEPKQKPEEEEEEEEEIVEISVEQDPIVVVGDNQPLSAGERTTIEIEQPVKLESDDGKDAANTTSAGPEQLAIEEKTVTSEVEPSQTTDKPTVKAEDTNEPDQEIEVKIDDKVQMDVEQKEFPEVIGEQKQKTDQDDLISTQQKREPGSEPEHEEREIKSADAHQAIASEAKKQAEEGSGASDDKFGEQKSSEQLEAKIPIEEVDDGHNQVVKPKKVKKKIIVVKKKKKISKKTDEPESSQSTEHQQQVATNEDDKSDNDPTATKQQQAGEQVPPKTTTTTPDKQTNVTKRGKVKIPDTFQAPEASADLPQAPTPSPVSQARRRSAMIADVSQKLLQSAKAEPRPVAPTIIESDQLQLKNVSVSDKKDELERRTSLAQQQAEQLAALQQLAASAAASAQRSQTVSPAAAATVAEQQVEALQAKLVREMQSSCAADTAESNSIPKLEPNLVEPAALIEPSERQLIQLLETPPADERSDSLETIKAADQATPASNSVRSSMQIDLSPLQDICQEMWQDQAEGGDKSPPATATASGGPAPIARSYKKVTFTKDGACITETGKIYSTKANDGTLRRVERKSKVTHYPPQNTGGSRSKIHKEEEEEEVVYCDSTPGSKSRHLERLIMPSSQFGAAEDSDSNDEDDFLSLTARGFHNNNNNNNRGQQERIDRTGSMSSCSSGSTDALEDIFDTWTGAISMFNRPSSKLFERAASRLSSAGSFGRRRQHRVSSSSQAGTPRCESVEPQVQGASKQAKQGTSADRPQQSNSGYESDAAGGQHQRRSHQRRSRMPGSARGLFGSWNLLNELDMGDEDPFSCSAIGKERRQQRQRALFDRDPFEILEQEQQSLRDRLAQQHKQLWKGSTPSLFDDFSFGKDQQSTSSSSFNSRKPPTIAKDPRLPSGHKSAQPTINQSSSSGSFKLQQQQQIHRQTATPLEAAPIRRNTTNFSPKVQKSTSSQTAAAASTITTTSKSSHQSFIQSGEKTAEQQQATTFIELKRTSSSLGSASLLRSCSSRLKIQQQQPAEVSSNINDESTSSSTFWTNRQTPQIAGSLDTDLTLASEIMSPSTTGTPTAEALGQSPARESIDKRVQNWLQESSGNLSATSSGSKSSQSASISDSLNSSRRAHDPFENLYGSLWQTSKSSHSTSSSRTKMIADQQPATGVGLPPQTAAATASSSSRTTLFQQVDGRQLLRRSISGNVVVSKLQQSVRESTDCSGETKASKQSIIKTMVESSSSQKNIESLGGDHEQAGSASRIATSRASSIIMKQTTGRATSPLIRDTQETSRTPQTASSGREQIRWVQQSVAEQSRIDELDFDSLSGDLESHSSSSLLDQLRTKGYRSMINKRMVDVSDSMAKSSSSSAARLIMGEEDGAPKGATTIVQESYSSSSSSRISKKTQRDNDNNIIEDEGPRKDAESDERHIQLNGAPPPLCPSVSVKLETSDEIAPSVIRNITEDQRNEQIVVDVDVDVDEDEDVRVAKANIKCHLDRIKETELFLKSLKQDEESYERQRHQMILFNDLMLGTKLNGFKSFAGQNMMDPSLASADSGSGDSSFYRTNTGLRSAPVRSYRCETSNTREQDTNEFLTGATQSSGLSSAALSFEPTYVLPKSSRTMTHTGCNGLSSEPPSKSTHDPLLEPVKPIFYNTHSDHYGFSASPQEHDYSIQPMDRFRRSRSQLSDQFTSYKRNRPSMETTSFPTNSPIVATNEIYYPSRAKRSLSQLRYSSNRLSQPVVMSEYRSAYSNPTNREHSNRDISPAVSPVKFGASYDTRNQTNGRHRDDEDDDGMSAYRVSSYVPKVVPETTIGRERSREKRRSYFPPSKVAAKTDDNNEEDDLVSSRRQRRTSLQSFSYGGSPSKLPSQESGTAAARSDGRRRSLTSTGEQTNSNSLSAGNSRLSELEQRIKENKRRREELLAGKQPVDPTTSDSTSNLENSSPPRVRRESSAVAAMAAATSPAAMSSSNGSTGISSFNRSSRLESMEARIKRRSYCVRVGDCSPERALLLRGQMSLEKWRQASQPSSSSGGRADSLTDSSNLLLSKVTETALKQRSTKANQDED